MATRVPDHRDLVLAALAAGKHVYSEWPLGRGSPEAVELARAAAASGVHHVIGLQLRANPAVRAARALLAAGGIGRLLSFSALSSTAGFGPTVPAPYIYLEDPAAFANLVTIQGAHTFDLVAALGGDPATLAALASRQFPDVVAGDDATPQRRETFDHLLVQGRLASAATFALEVAGGREGETPFFLDIVGETGSLRLDGGAPRGLQSGRIGLIENGTRVEIDEGELAGLPDEAVNVAGVYAELRDDIRTGSRAALGFDHAVWLTGMIETALRSSNEARTVEIEERSA